MKNAKTEIKILHIQLLPLLTGVQNVMLNLISHLELENKEKCHRYFTPKFTFSVASAPGGPLVEKLNDMQIKHFPISGLVQKIILYDIIIFWKFYRICRICKFDIVHTHSSKTGFLGRIAARLAGVPIVIHTIHGFSFNPFQSFPKRLFFMFLEWVGALFCDLAISVNDSERFVAVEKKIIPRSKIITIYNGIEPLKPTGEIKRSDLGFNNSDIIFGCVSRFSKQKNILKLIKIAIGITKQDDKIKFVFVGDGEMFSQAKKMIGDADCAHSINLPGWQSNIPEWNKLFDVYILYSLWEGLSLSVIEALSLAKPVILSNIKGNNELVDEGKNGFLADVKRGKDLEEKILLLTRDKTLIEEMGKESKIKFQKRFTVKRFVENYRKQYKKLIQEKL
ncbi:MAG: glycosyltransferase family 4 protein [Candidatus Cloacimonadota bacterium]|nr:glycosyltransferase family 4 protein [Candidatus Cloacimonadota bacterium]